MKKYCLGFLFNMDGTQVVLIQKKKPAWQLNKFNGIGGKIEENETPEYAMRREFEEEAGMFVNDWTEFCVLQGDGFKVHCFCAYSGDYTDAQTQQIVIGLNVVEPVFTFWVDKLPLGTIPNVRWLIPMALSMARGESCRHFTVSETV